MNKLIKYAKLSGPGWLQAAVTLGGGSLAGALYLGVVGGDGLLWLQPMAMFFGVVMLSALAYVTLSTDDTPFVSTCKYVSPILAWAWLIATIIADCVFCPAQASLGLGIVQQNFGLSEDQVNPYLITSVMALISFSVIFLYIKGSKGVVTFENILKVMVGLVILCFFGAAVANMMNGNVNFGSVMKGLIPNPSSLFNAPDSLNDSIAATGDAASWWKDKAANSQRDVIITAFATAVGINMTFLLPYTLRKKKWGKKERELSRYDLILGLAVPFVVATFFLVVTSSAQFHNKYDDVLGKDGQPIALEDGYYKLLSARLTVDGDVPTDQVAMRAAADALPLADKRLAASLTKRDAGQLATALTPLVGEKNAQLIFGIGIFAMSISTMIVHMLMNGFALSQAMGKPGDKTPFLIGAAMPAVTAALAPLLWSGSNKAAMAIPASVIAGTLLPIAYLIFILLMNSKRTLGEEKLTGKKLMIVNIVMGTGFFVATFASIWALNSKGTAGMYGIIGLVGLAIIGILGFIKRNKEA
jgi:Mn2+/Fe2+ NRAMP family transporter